MLSRLISSKFFLLVILACIVFILLGNWQLRRLQWKTELIERVETRIHAVPVAAPLQLHASNISKQKHEYLRVKVKGQFLHQQETLVQTTTEIGSGYWVMTPLVSGDSTILINRGFVPEEFKQTGKREDGLVLGEQTVIGLLRLTEPEGQLFRNNEPAEGRWYSRDVEAIAKTKSLKQVAPFFIDAEKTDLSAELPIAGMTRIQFRNTHLIYALTWYGLALLLFFMSYRAITCKEV